MISIIADTHTHTVACDHAFSTVSENTQAAVKKGLKILAITEHSHSLPGGASNIHFICLSGLPRFVNSVMLLKGAEVNIIDYNGSLDLPETITAGLEWVIASLHSPVIAPSDRKEHTRCWMQIANNPHVDVIGHCGDERYIFDFRPVIAEFKRCGKIVEINSHSFDCRPGSNKNCRQVAELCAEYGVPIVVSSDAHIFSNIGAFDSALKMLGEIDFPKELILNADYDRFLAVAREKSGCVLTDEE